MSIDWAQLSVDLEAGTSFGTDVAQRALEQIVGKDNIRAAVELILDEKPGWTAAQSVLVHIMSDYALDLAYTAYKTSTGSRAVRAVALIKDLGHPRAKAWIPEFLADPNLGTLGIDVLDQLIFTHAVDPEAEDIEALLKMAEQHASAQVREGAASIRAYLQEWQEG